VGIAEITLGSDIPARRDRFFVICAQQRSGTTALGKALGRTSTIETYAEIFHDKSGGDPRNYFEFLKIDDSNLQYLRYPSQDNRKILFGKYLNYLHNLGRKKHIVLDIKYNSWHNFDSIWHSPMAPPVLLDFFKSENVNIIHVQRRNLVSQYVSLAYSDASGKYFYTETDRNESDTSKSIYIDTKLLLNSLLVTQATQNLFRSFLRNYPNSLDLYYDEIYNGQRVASEATEKLRSIFHFEDSELTTDQIMTPRRPASAVSNREEVLAALAHTPFAEMAMEAFQDGTSEATPAGAQQPAPQSTV